MEELRAATEEAQSSNEELQSTNEELETAKEELQATNEELTTVNDELNNRNLELGQLSNDLANLLASTHVPILMVGHDLRIRRMTPVAERVLNVPRATSGGRSGTSGSASTIPDLEALLREVIETLAARSARSRPATAAGTRCESGRTGPADNKIDGAVISFVDIDALKRGLRAGQGGARSGRGHRRDGARAARDPRRRPPRGDGEPVLLRDLPGQAGGDRGPAPLRPREPPVEHPAAPDAAGGGPAAGPASFEDFEVEHEFERIGRRTMLLNARRVRPGDRPAGP